LLDGTHARPRRSFPLTQVTLAALAVGLGVGILAHATGSGFLAPWVPILAPVGKVWTNALRMTVIPLIVSLIVVSIAVASSGRAVGKLGGLGFCAFIGLLVLGALYTLALSGPLLSGFHGDPETQAAFRSGSDEARVAEEVAKRRPPGFSDGLIGLVPTNPFEAAAKGEILPLLLLALLFGLALRSVAEERRTSVVSFFGGIVDAMMTILR
jgi:proton glutamate symport protein